MKTIDKELRLAIMAVVHELGLWHDLTGKHESCRTCGRVEELMNLLEAEQREYGPPIDVTDPSFIREYGSEVSR